MQRPPALVAVTCNGPGIILSPREHSRHHVAPFAQHYCIATGWCNRCLAAIDFFPRLERLITRLTGLEPRDDDSAFQASVAAQDGRRLPWMTDSPVPRPGAHLSLKTTEPQSFGHGWISGVFAVVLGILGLGAVLCFHYPEWLTMPELRGRYPLPYVRALVHVVLVAAFLLGTVSVCLRQNKALGLTGITLVLIAALLGGSRVPIDRDVPAGGLFGLDWFLLNLILFSVVYIPLERLFAKHPEQPVFRKAWRTDLTYFFLSNLLVQVTTILTLGPAMVFFDWARNPRVVSWVARRRCRSSS